MFNARKTQKTFDDLTNQCKYDSQDIVKQLNDDFYENVIFVEIKPIKI